MDRMLYIAMTGAQQNMHAQAVNNHNLANANTHGFRQALNYAYTEPMRGPVFDSRDYVQFASEAIDFSPGTLQSTGRDLDVAIQGNGFFVVEALDGTLGLTRGGSFHLDAQGVLRNESGLPVMGEGGQIAIPPAESISIGGDGTLSIRPLGNNPQALAALDRLMLVNPELDTLDRGADGLLRDREGQEIPPDANVRVLSGMLETSNVNTAAALTRMIELSRQYEMNVQMMKTSSELAKRNNQLLSL